MKFNPIISEIIRGQFLIDHVGIESYVSIIDSLLKGQKIEFNSNYAPEPIAMDILDENGNPLISQGGEVLQVPKNSIAQVKMQGEIVRYGDWCATGADEVVGQLYQAQSLQNVDATILRVDGPGGTVKAIGPFREFAKYKTKPIIGLADDALSLHYWAMCEVCDYIIADNDVSARFGSVGVVSSFKDNQKALEKLGYTFHEIYPDESEHKNLAFTLAREGKYDMIKKEHLSPLAIKFQDGVIKTRPNLIKEVGVLTGKTFYADQAKEYGMIDDIGDITLAMKVARQLSHQKLIKSLI